MVDATYTQNLHERSRCKRWAANHPWNVCHGKNGSELGLQDQDPLLNRWMVTWDKWNCNVADLCLSCRKWVSIHAFWIFCSQQHFPANLLQLSITSYTNYCVQGIFESNPQDGLPTEFHSKKNIGVRSNLKNILLCRFSAALRRRCCNDTAHRKFVTSMDSISAPTMMTSSWNSPYLPSVELGAAW